MIPVGFRIGAFISFLIDNFGGSLSDYHPIGFSLGGQVVGNVGHALNGELPRITGLDPAGTVARFEGLVCTTYYIDISFPNQILGFLFHTEPDSAKISKSSAQFVDIIHSAGLWIGTDEPVWIQKKTRSCFMSD